MQPRRLRIPKHIPKRLVAGAAAAVGLVALVVVAMVSPVLPDAQGLRWPALTLVEAGTPTPFRGVGLSDRPEPSCQDLTTLGVAWYYDWTTEEPCPQQGADFVPMVWGDWCAADADCTELPRRIAATGVDTVLGFNEPENPDQSVVSVARALELWPALDATALRLGSPAVSNSAAGAAWLDDFLAGTRERGLRVDFVAVHWYGDCSSTAPLTEYLEDLGRHGLPIWLTEFSCRFADVESNRRFLDEIGPLLARSALVERVAWFTNRRYGNGWDDTALIGDAGEPTDVGAAFQGLPACLRRLTGTAIGPCLPRGPE